MVAGPTRYRQDDRRRKARCVGRVRPLDVSEKARPEVREEGPSNVVAEEDALQDECEILEFRSAGWRSQTIQQPESRLQVDRPREDGQR